MSSTAAALFLPSCNTGVKCRNMAKAISSFLLDGTEVLQRCPSAHHSFSPYGLDECVYSPLQFQNKEIITGATNHSWDYKIECKSYLLLARLDTRTKVSQQQTRNSSYMEGCICDSASGLTWRDQSSQAFCMLTACTKFYIYGSKIA